MKETLSIAGGVFEALTYPSHSYASEHANLMEDIARGWIDDYDCLSGSFKEKTRMANYGVLTAEVMPLAPLKVLIPVTRWMLWAFVFDDYYGPMPKDELDLICKKAIHILKGQEPAANDNALFRQLAIIRDELTAISDPYWMSRFIDDHHYYFSGLLMDTYSYQQHINYPSSARYLAIRDRLIGGHMVCDLLELSSGFIFPQELSLHPSIKRLRLLATRLMIWDNDIFSYRKELAEGEAMNIVLVLHAEKDISIDQAVSRAIKIRRRYYNEILEFGSKTGEFGIYSRQIERFHEHTMVLLRGQLDWYLRISKRYM